jgi:hypothetical protein
MFIGTGEINVTANYPNAGSKEMELNEKFCQKIQSCRT